MNSRILIAIILGVLIIAGGTFIFTKFKTSDKSNQRQNQEFSNQEQHESLTPTPQAPTEATEPPSLLPPSPPGPKPPPPPPVVPPPPPAPPTAPQGFIIEADDYHASPPQITANKGSQITVVFKVGTVNVYYGGLDFRSPVVNTGSIPPGGSKEVTFTANQSFDFTPYWPASNVKKNYTVKVIVQ